MGGTGQVCPFEFNVDRATLAELHDDFMVIAGDATKPETRYRATRESRPGVDDSQL